MPIDANALVALIDSELDCLSDARVLRHIRSLLVAPSAVLRAWDYGAPGERYPCWAVLDHSPSNTGIAYCERGFGPRCPWGLVWLGGDRPMSMGMDSSWFPTFLGAYFDSFASTDVPIWRVFEVSSTTEVAVTDESAWELAWERVRDCQQREPRRRYEVGHGIRYRKE
jgi:hypothetical protein